MGAFNYQALDPLGRTVTGVLEGDAERHVRSALRDRGLAPLWVEPVFAGRAGVRATALRPFGRLGPDLSGSELNLVTAQFAALVRAGLTVEECLGALAEQAESRRARAVLAGVRARVQQGESLSRALAAFPGAFPEMHVHLVGAGEQSGRLDEVLERLAEHSEKRDQLQQKVVLALVYPALVAVVAFLVVGGLLVSVVPQVSRVFVASGQTLPWSTRLLLAVTGWAGTGPAPLLAGLLACGWALYALLRLEPARRRWHEWVLRLPLAGRFVRSLNSARWTSTLGILLSSGVPLPTAMKSAVRVVTNLPMRAAAEEALRQVSEGKPLSRALRAGGLFPPVTIHLIANGERSGRLAQMLERAAESQSRELDRRVAGLTALVEPLLILGLGAVVLFIVMAILSPIIEINQWVR